MKKDVVLLIDADADTAATVATAASLAHCDVRLARTSRDLFQLCHNGFEDVASIVVDVDPGVHGMAVLEALDGMENVPPVIVVSSLEESYLEPVARAHGACTSLGKPLCTARLKRLLEQNRATAPQESACCCDAWGHPCEGCRPPRGVGALIFQEFAVRN
jgi:DNA-binding response OmpR family regulator